MLSVRNNQLTLGKTGPLNLFKHRIMQRQRSKHMLVLGVTGQGKSKLMEHCIFQDITAGRGCGVLDPHGDLAEDTIRYLASQPEKAAPHWDRIIYLDLNSGYAIPFNVFKTNSDKHATVENVIEAFRRTWPDSLKVSVAARFSQIARSAFLVLLENNLALTQLRTLLVNEGYREKLLKNVSDQETVNFFQGEYNDWGNDQSLYTGSLLNKSSAFLFHPTVRAMLGQKENRLNFTQIMDEGKVLIINLGGIAGETRRLLGSLITTGLELSALSRSGGNRQPFYFYIDEFQGMCANEGSEQTLSHILSQARKFGLHFTLATQTLLNVSSRMQHALENIGLKIVLGVGRGTAEKVSRKIFMADTEEVKHAPQTETQHPLYSSLMEVWERQVQKLQNLPERHAYVKVPKQEPVKIKTITVDDNRCSWEELQRITTSLAARSGRPLSSLKEKAEGGSEREERANGEVSTSTKMGEEAKFWEEAKPSRSHSLAYWSLKD